MLGVESYYSSGSGWLFVLKTSVWIESGWLYF